MGTRYYIEGTKIFFFSPGLNQPPYTTYIKVRFMDTPAVVRKKRRIFFMRSMVCTLEEKFPDKNSSGHFVTSFVLEQTCNFYEYFSDFVIVYNK